MITMDFCKSLVSNGYIERRTDFQNTYAYEFNGDIGRVVIVTGEDDIYRNENFIWYVNNLINLYGYSNVLIVAFTNASSVVRNSMPRVQYWIFNNNSGRLEIYENQPYDFFGIKAWLENAKPAKDYNRFLNFNVLIVVINVIIFVIMEAIGNTDNAQFLYEHGGKTPESVIIGNEYYRYISSMFLHSGVIHLFNNMLLLFFVGDNLERVLGHVKYIILYFGSGLIAGILSQVYYYTCGDLYVVCVGASGAIFGVLGALIWVLIRNKGRLEELSLFRMILYCALSLGINVDGVNVAAHIAGLVGGFLLAIILYRRRGTRYEN